ncbi:MAG: MFS transporter [Actinomycetota bacterium]
MTGSGPPFPHLTIALLGLVTVAAYGTWYYAFGVLLLPLLDDTGWSEGLVAGTYSAATALGALLGVPAGRVIDRVGSRPAFLAAAGCSVVGLVGASMAGNPALFALGAVPGAASLQALAFYHVTQTTAVRAAPGQPARAIAWLTIYGAFSSFIYLPLASELVVRWGWRQALRLLVVSTAVVLVVAALAVREQSQPVAPRRPGAAVRAALAPGAPRRYLIASALIGLAVGTVLLYQVPIMIGAGLPATTAAWVAGARGMAQVSGRVPLGWMLQRMEARTAVRVAFIAITVGITLLAFAGNIVVALGYVIAAGFGIGATSPLQGIYADELFERSSLGESMGLLTMVFGLSTAVGPAVVGVLVETTGSRWWGSVLAALAAAGAVVAMTLPVAPAAVPEGAGAD